MGVTVRHLLDAVELDLEQVEPIGIERLPRAMDAG